MTNENTSRSVVRIKTALARQRRMVLYLLIAVAVLAIALAIVLFLTSRTPFYDPTDNTKYYVAKEDGLYVLKTTKGEVLPTTEDGNNYITAAGTLVYVNAKTGEFSTVAAVLIEDGETVRFDTLNGEYDVLLYPLIERSGIQTIRITNSNGSFAFQRQETTVDGVPTVEFVIENRPDLAVDQTILFATAVYFTGRAQTMLRLDTNRVKEMGYAEYGLPEDVSTATTYYEITATAQQGGATHKVIIGDQVPSGNGYYVRYAGRDAVYVLSDLNKGEYNGTFEEALLGRVEDYVSAMGVSYGMDQNNYYDVSDFRLYKNGQEKPLAGFSYSGSIDKRNDTFYATLPYVTDTDLSGYSIDSYSAEGALYTMLNWQPDFVVKIGDATTMNDADINEWLKPYGLDTDSYAYYISFTHNQERTYNKKTGKDVISPAKQEKHTILVSHKQKDGYYYVFNICYIYNEKDQDFTTLADGYNMIVALDETQLGFLFYREMDWISDELFWAPIAYLDRLTITIAPGKVSQYPNGYTETFILDNSKTLNDIAQNGSSSQLSTDKLVVQDSGQNSNRVRTIDTLQFKRFYQSLLYTTCPGYSGLTQEQKQANIASGSAGAVLTIKLRYVLRERNEDTGYYDTTGEVVELEYCFYANREIPMQYHTTVNGAGDFYVTTSRIKKLINDVMKLYDPNDPIDYSSLN